MNEQALQDAYTLFSQKGYNGSFDEFVELIYSNPDALGDSYTLFTEGGYAGSFEDFSSLMGVKKKDETEIDMVSPLETGTSQPSELSRNQRLNVSAGPEKDTAIERAFGKNEVTDFFGDIYRAWKTGAGQGATVDDAIKVFASGSNVSDKNLQQYIDAVQNMESFAPSEEMQDFSRIYEAEGKGIKGFIKGILKNPTAAIQVATSSLRAMLNPASIGAGAAGAGAGALAGPAGVGAGAIIGMTGALETGLSFTEFLKEELNEKGLGFTDDNIRTILEDDEAMGNITRRSLARGATISTISALTGGLAAGVGANVGRNVALKLGTQAGRAASAAAGLGVQAVGGGAGEAIGRAAAGQEMDVAEIGFEAIGEIASPSLIGTVTAVAKVPKYNINKEQVSEEAVKEIIKTTKDFTELDNIKIKIEDNPVLEAELQKRKKELLDIESYKKGMTPEQLANATEEDILELVSLQNKLTEYNDSGNEAGKDNAAKVKAQIITKLDALQEPSTEKVDVQKPSPDSETVGKGDTEQQSTTREITSKPITDSTEQAEEVETQVKDDASEVDIKNKSTEELEVLQSKIEDSQNPKDQNLFGKIDNELENREWKSILYAPLNKINSIVESLLIKEKEMPFGFGPYIEKWDARKVKSIVDEYSNPVSKSQAQKDFKTGLLGNPDTSYSDALLVRESVQSFINSGGTFLELVKSAENEFTSQGFSEEQAAGVIQQRLENIKSRGLAEEVTQEDVVEEDIDIRYSKNENDADFKNSLFNLQDTTAEPFLNKGNWGKAMVWRKKIEDAGDIFRELNLGNSKDYIQEKIDSLKYFIERRKERGVVKNTDGDFVDSYQYLIENHSDAVDKIKSDYEALPVESDLNILARDLIYDVLNNNLVEAEKKLNKIQSVLDRDSSNVLARNPETIVGRLADPTEQVTQEEVVEETYTLPEDPRKAKKDFQIIDNRDGFIEELDDDGSNKWILRNIKTDFYGTATTKTEAQQFLNNTVNREGRTMDYGEGQPLLEEFRTQVEEEVVEEVAPVTRYYDMNTKEFSLSVKIGNFDVVIKDDKIVSITKDGKKPSTRSRRRVQNKILDQELINVEKGGIVDYQGSDEVEVSTLISDESTNAKEVANEIETVQEKIKEQNQKKSTKKGDISQSNSLALLFNLKFDPDTFEDVNELTPKEKKTWIASKEKGGVSIKDGWQQIFIDNNFPVPDAKTVLDFIQEFTTRAEFNRSLEFFTPQLLTDLKSKFTELTGLDSTDSNIQRVISASPETTTRIAEEEAMDVKVKEEKQKEQAQKKLTKKEISEAKKEAVEKERKKTIDNTNRKNALSNIKKGKLGTEESTVVLKNIFTIQPKIIRAAIKEGVLPAEILTRYNELAKLIGQRKAVLRDLPEVRDIKKKADALYNELIDGINKEIEEVGEAEVEQVDVDKLKTDILSMPVKINTALDKASRDLATKIKRLSDADLDLLIEETEDGTQDVRKLNQLELIKKNINAGFVPAAANDIINTIETRKDTKSLTPKVEKISTKGLQGGLRKSFFNIGRALNLIKTGNFFEAVFKSNPKTVFDDLMGNANDTTIFEKLIRPLAAAFSQYDVQRSNVLKESIEKIEKLIAFDGNKRIERSQNEIIKDKMKIMTYLLQLEHESNPIESNQEQNLTPPALAFIDETINYYIDNAPTEDVVTIKMLNEIKNEFTVDGKIDLNKLKNSFSSNINKAVDEYRKAFDNLADKTDFVSAILRRNKVNLFNNYVKHVVLYNPSDKEAVYNEQRDKFTQKASAKSGSIEERIPGAKALSFDPSYALMKATDDILLDFNMTNEIRKFRMKINSLKKIEGLTPLQQQALIALERSMEKALSSTFDSINSDPSATITLINEIRRIGYEAALVSAPRAVAELSSNFLFAISANPDATLDGIKNYGGVAKENGTMLNFLSNIGSTEATKLANVDEITGKLTDDLGVDKYVSKSGKAAPQLKSILLQINNYGPKQLRNFTADLSNKILSYPDQMIGRPLYLGEFVRVFEQETRIRLTEDDIRGMAKGPGESKYLSQEYAEAINKAAIAADKQAIMSTTSRNPILAIEKFKRKKDATAFQEIYREANAFMSNFFAFEYTTARTAVNALFNQGAISNKQALGLLLGITMRMTMYQIIYKVLSDNVDQAFREKDDDDIDETQEIVDETARSLTGSIITLLTRQTMGNVPFAAIAYGLERFNENNLGALRSDEEYDAFKHSIVYSQLGKKDLESENLMSNVATLFAGPYGTILRRLQRNYELIQRTQTRKTESARQEAQDEFNRNILLDISGNAGLLPFYKDVRRIINAKRNKEYKEKQGAMSKSELRKLNPKLYKKLYGPGSADARLRALKRKLESN